MDIKKWIINHVKFRFIGWGMSTKHQVPWNNNEENFLKTNEDIRNNFKFNKNLNGVSPKILDELLWRHWNVTYAIRHSILAVNHSPVFVECGVGEGITAFFSISEAKGNCISHLYDSWEQKGEKYRGINLEITKQNLKKFEKNIIYHKGFIPTTLDDSAPDKITFMHIDLNDEKSTLEALNFFYPKLEKNGVILFDDYGWLAYGKTKKIVDEFFKEKLLLILPTGQALHFKV